MLPLAQKADVPLVTTFYGYDLSYLPKQEPEWKEKYQRLFSEGSAFLLEGSHMRDQLVKLGCPPEKAHVQHLGVDVDRWEFQSRTKSDGEPLRILFVGRFTEKKGLRYGIDGFARAIDAGVDAHLTVIGDADGSGRSQQEKEYVLRHMEASGLDDRIDLRGFVPHDELIRAYYDHHVLLAPSVEASDGDTEGGAPVTLIEAQATGLPVVSTAHCDIPEVVVDGETGLLAPEHDADALAEHLATLSSNPSLLSRFGEAGREHVSAEYNAAVQGERLADRYDDILSTSPRDR
jgi:colanic acid/amylovoran biosynthesis glycosyltransferase